MTARLLLEADRLEYKVYQLRGVTYVPHYSIPKAYVSPGYGRHHQNLYERLELMRAGAKEVTMSLFKRSN